jgi:regulator of replication initiation timing
MRTLQEHLDDLDRMVDNGSAPKHEIRSQIAFIGREVTALQAENTRLVEAHAKLQTEKEKVDTELAALKIIKSGSPPATVVSSTPRQATREKLRGL